MTTVSLRRHYKSCGKSHAKDLNAWRGKPWRDLGKQTQRVGSVGVPIFACYISNSLVAFWQLFLNEYEWMYVSPNSESSAKYGGAWPGQRRVNETCQLEVDTSLDRKSVQLTKNWRDVVPSTSSSEKPSGSILDGLNFADEAGRRALNYNSRRDLGFKIHLEFK